MTTAEPITTHSSGWQPYALDHVAQELVVSRRDQKEVLNESHKMRMAVAYGLERFWGEHLRFERESKNAEKAAYWKAVWVELAKILKLADIELPDAEGKIRFKDTDDIKRAAGEIWAMPREDQEVALMVLTQFCDSLVWWTQRYKSKTGGGSN